MDAPKCETCRFFHEMGECRRRAPVQRSHDSNDLDNERGVWPRVWVDDWCGEHQPAPREGGTR